MARLAADVDRAQGVNPSYGAGDILVEWGRPDFDLAQDTWVIEGEARVAAFGQLVARGQGHLTLMIWLSPEGSQGIAQPLVEAMERRGREIASNSPYKKGIAVASDEEQELRGAIEVSGFLPDALFVEMGMEMGDLGPPTVPDGYRIRDFDPSQAHAFYDALVSSFEEHWGSGFEPFEAWWRDSKKHDDFDPSLWFVMTRGGDEIAGVLVAQISGGVGDIHAIGVLRAHRGRSLGEVLMKAAFIRLKERGATKARLWVDTKNVTNALGLYERVGMSVTRRMNFYAKPLA